MDRYSNPQKSYFVQSPKTMSSEGYYANYTRYLTYIIYICVTGLAFPAWYIRDPLGRVAGQNVVCVVPRETPALSTYSTLCKFIATTSTTGVSVKPSPIPRAPPAT